MTNFFSILQRVGKAFMLPIALLPAAGLLLGIGGAFTSVQTIKTYGLEDILGQGTIFYFILTIMKNTGDIVFANLPLIFSIGIAVGLAKNDKGTAGLAGTIGFLIMHKTISSILEIQGLTADTTSVNYLSKAMSMDIIDATSKSQEYTYTLGIFTLQMSVFGGFISGCVTSFLHNKYYNIKLPQILGFFGGSRFVPIITTIVMLFVGVILVFIWPIFQHGILFISYWIEQAGYLGTLIYGMMERALVPIGLHHILATTFWQTSLGGTMEIGGKIVTGAQNIFFAQLSDPNTSHFEVTRGSRFWVGKYPFMMFGLPAAALAMYHTSKPENKKIVGPLLFSVAITSFLTGITEPIEFTFLFVAPLLYYAIHVPLAGLSFMLMHIFDVGVGVTFASGFIDFFLYGILQGQSKTNWIVVPLLGILYAPIYYCIFKFIIIKLNLKTPGREDEALDKQSFLQTEKIGENLKEIAMKIFKGLGGSDNIESIDACITKIRITVKDPILLESNEYFRNLGAKGIIKKDKAIQIVFGTLSDSIRIEMEGQLLLI